MLLLSTLTSNIQSIFNKRLSNINQIASEIALAYQKYAMSAIGMLGEPCVLTGSEHIKLRSGLIALMRGKYPSTQAANAIGNAIQAFWLTPPILTAGGGTCVTIVTSAGIAQMTNTSVNSSGEAARALANALDTITRMTFIVYPYPLPPGFIK
jgi:hypothetical protein